MRVGCGGVMRGTGARAHHERLFVSHLLRYSSTAASASELAAAEPAVCLEGARGVDMGSRLLELLLPYGLIEYMY